MSTDLRIRRVESGADLRRLLDLPEQLYASDPCWVPPLRVVEQRRVRAFLERGRLTLFLAERGGRAVGSVSVLRDEPVHWFGYFEAEEDPAVARALLGTAADEARRQGATALRGPRNLTRFEFVGLTVEGFDRLPPMLQGQHRPWYAERIEAAGFARHHDVLAYESPLYDAAGAPVPLPDNLRQKSRDLDLPGLEVRRARWRHIGRDLSDAHEVLNAAYATVPEVSPMPRSTFLALGRTYLAFANTELMQLAYVEGRPAAFAVCLPEINEALAGLRGHLLPAGWLRLGLGLRRIRSVGFKLIGVLPELRGSGLHARLIEHVVEGARRAGYTRIDGSVIDERNKPMRAVVEGAGLTIYRRYRFYELPLGDENSAKTDV